MGNWAARESPDTGPRKVGAPAFLDLSPAARARVAEATGIFLRQSCDAQLGLNKERQSKQGP